MHILEKVYSFSGLNKCTSLEGEGFLKFIVPVLCDPCKIYMADILKPMWSCAS